jgi:broad specificity phosphatase PhoE
VARPGTSITEHILEAYHLNGFDRYLYSPHCRTRETAAHLGLPDADWRLARLLREREWGEVAGLMGPEHAALYPRNHAWMRADPLNWAPPGASRSPRSPTTC